MCHFLIVIGCCHKPSGLLSKSHTDNYSFTLGTKGVILGKCITYLSPSV